MRRADIEVPNLAVDVNSWARSACYPRGSFYPLSHTPSTRKCGITKPDFRPCSRCPARSQAPFCLCTLPGGVHSPGGNPWAPPLPFGRRPPQSNYPPGPVCRPVSGCGMRHKIVQEWYFTVASPTPTRVGSPAPTYPTHAPPRLQARV